MKYAKTKCLRWSHLSFLMQLLMQLWPSILPAVSHAFPPETQATSQCLAQLPHATSVFYLLFAPLLLLARLADVAELAVNAVFASLCVHEGAWLALASIVCD